VDPGAVDTVTGQEKSAVLIDVDSPSIEVRKRSASNDLAGLEARSTDIELAYSSGADLGPNRLDVRVPPTMRPTV